MQAHRCVHLSGFQGQLLFPFFSLHCLCQFLLLSLCLSSVLAAVYSRFTDEKLSGRTFPRDGDPLTPKTRPRHHRMQSARGFGLLSGYTGTGTCGRFSHSGDWRAPRNQGWAFIGFWGAEASIQKQMHGYRDIIGGF